MTTQATHHKKDSVDRFGALRTLLALLSTAWFVGVIYAHYLWWFRTESVLENEAFCYPIIFVVLPIILAMKPGKREGLIFATGALLVFIRIQIGH